MSAPSPLVAAGSQVAFSVKVKGAAISSALQVVSVETWSAVNRVPRARLVLYDGSPAEGTFPASASDTFVPGNAVEIAAGYDDGAKTVIFSGIIVRQGIEIGQAGASRLVVDLTDRALKMTLERRNAVFSKTKDSTVIGKLIGSNGLRAKVTDTKVELPEVVQYYASDWDLMVTRAELNGFVAITEAGTVTVGPPDTAKAPVLTVRYGESVLDLQAEMDAATQLAPASIRSYTWDPAQQKVVDAGPGSVRVTEPGNLSSDELAKVFGVKKFTQQTGGPLEKGSLEGWSSAELLKSKLSKIRGWVRFQGSALARTGAMLELAGLGGRFDGRAYLSGVHHSISDGRWLTTVDFGLSAKWFAADTPGVEAPPASGQLPAVQGLQTGVVKKVAGDPGGEFRVQVNLPLVGDAKNALVWARLATFYASSKVGALFYPEVGDEVVVAFMNDDPRFAVVLGSVYSRKLAPPFPPEEKNDRKAIVTRGKLQVTFDDKDRVLEVRTPKQFVRLDDKAGEVRVEDANRNRVVLSKSGIVLESASNLAITAKGNVTIDAKGNLSLKAAATAAMEGSLVSHKAKVKYVANSGGLAELKASGLVKVTGAIVKIN
jgi:Rhs element Vgr protein